jgi:hypothetical protein
MKNTGELRPFETGVWFVKVVDSKANGKSFDVLGDDFADARDMADEYMKLHELIDDWSIVEIRRYSMAFGTR